MVEPLEVPTFRVFSPTKRVDVLVSDWRSELPPELPAEELERRLYGKVLDEYGTGDFAFGLWCWFECDRLSNAFRGKVGEVTRVVGEGRYLGFSHRKAIAQEVPMDRIYRPRKGDMSTPRPEAVVLAPYQLLCVYAVRAAGGDPRSKAQLEIALGELAERRRTDPFVPHFETFRRLLERSGRPKEPSAEPPRPSEAPRSRPPAETPGGPGRGSKGRRVDDQM
ncbi:MAG TPA: hypothetical protein VGV64_08325 [Thermoplasmata archaeon]|nr:hypothetical protein [Thermoplasmata archaeon]